VSWHNVLDVPKILSTIIMIINKNNPLSNQRFLNKYKFRKPINSIMITQTRKVMGMRRMRKWMSRNVVARLRRRS
jgi:hypothetical protein